MSDEWTKPAEAPRLVSPADARGIGGLLGFFVAPWVMTHPLLTGSSEGVLYCGNYLMNVAFAGAVVGGVAGPVLARLRG